MSTVIIISWIRFIIVTFSEIRWIRIHYNEVVVYSYPNGVQCSPFKRPLFSIPKLEFRSILLR